MGRYGSRGGRKVWADMRAEGERGCGQSRGGTQVWADMRAEGARRFGQSRGGTRASADMRGERTSRRGDTGDDRGRVEVKSVREVSLIHI